MATYARSLRDTENLDGMTVTNLPVTVKAGFTQAIFSAEPASPQALTSD
jgi:hypothetical protein